MRRDDLSGLRIALARVWPVVAASLAAGVAMAATGALVDWRWDPGAWRTAGVVAAAVTALGALAALAAPGRTAGPVAFAAALLLAPLGARLLEVSLQHGVVAGVPSAGWAPRLSDGRWVPFAAVVFLVARAGRD